jgi:hypothetical protein
MVYKISADEDRKYIEEFRRLPIGAHSPGLQRVLNIMRMDRGGNQYVLVCRKRFAEYVIGVMPPDRREPIELESEPVFATREEAEWEIFRRRWREHTQEDINQPFRD